MKRPLESKTIAALATKVLDRSVCKKAALRHSVAMALRDETIAASAVILDMVALHNIKATLDSLNSRSKDHKKVAITREIDLFSRNTVHQVWPK